jgi:Bacterial Ig domain
MFRIISRNSVLATAGTALLATGAIFALAGSSDAATANRRPICNNIGFTAPTAVGGKVTIPVLNVAADPDLTPVRLVSAFGGSPVGTAQIVNNSLEFTRTSTAQGEVTLYWTVSDGSLTAQCFASAPDPTIIYPG